MEWEPYWKGPSQANRKVKLTPQKINFSPPKIFLPTKKQFAGQILAYNQFLYLL